MRDGRFESSAVRSGVLTEMRRHRLPNSVDLPPCESLSPCRSPCHSGMTCSDSVYTATCGTKSDAGDSREQLCQENSAARVGPATICTQCPQFANSRRCWFLVPTVTVSGWTVEADVSAHTSLRGSNPAQVWQVASQTRQQHRWVKVRRGILLEAREGDQGRVSLITKTHTRSATGPGDSTDQKKKSQLDLLTPDGFRTARRTASGRNRTFSWSPNKKHLTAG